jgi:hypothetical protein
MRRPWLFTAWCSTTATAYLLCPTNPTVTAYSYTLTSSNLCAVLTILSVPAKPRYPKTDPRDTSNMNNSTQSTLVLLLYTFVVFNGIGYWRCVPYGSGVGSFVWITHRGPLLSYAPGFMALTAHRSCHTTAGEFPRHALCHIPYVGREWTFAFLAVVSAALWTAALSEVWLHWRSTVELPSGEEKEEDNKLGGRY